MNFEVEQTKAIADQEENKTTVDTSLEQDLLEEAPDEALSNDQKVERWRKLYQKIYLSVYDEQEFVWRKIKRREYVEIMDNTSEENIDDVVEYRQYLTIKACVLSPNVETELDDLLEEYPGLLTSLSAEILRKSGFSKPLTIEI